MQDPTEARPRFNPFSDPWPEGYSIEEFKADALAAVVSLVKSGTWGPDAFTSAEAYRHFCEQNGIVR